jgi:hypothetical protein
MDRKRLPTRRPNETVKVEINSMTYFLTLGYDPDTGRICEVFGSARKASSDLDYLVADACVVISIALQSGVEASDMLRSMHFEPVIGDPAMTRKPASLIGLICSQIIAAEGWG